MTARRMLFHRRFLGYTGGHGKVWDYFNHALASGWDARVHLTADSLRDASNPWLSVPDRIERAWRPCAADVLFLAGRDWEALAGIAADALPPIVNLIQGLRHADPAVPHRAFLRRRAWRICVGRAVADAILSTGEVEGPVRIIPAALHLPALADADAGVQEDVFIGAAKHRALGDTVAQRLRAAGHRVRLQQDWMPREAFLQAMRAARIVVLLPHREEGFFLPGLEAMALDRPLVMPPSGGSGEYARDGWNCLMPAADGDALGAAVLRLAAEPALADRLRGNAAATVARHGLPAEGAAFARVLDEMLQ